MAAQILDGKALAKRPVEWKKVPAIKTGAKEKNTLRITAKGRDVQIAINEMGEPITATPAVSDGLMVVRTVRAVYGIGVK